MASNVLSNAFKKSFRKLTSAVCLQAYPESACKSQDDFLSDDVVTLLQALPDSASLHSANGDAMWVSDKTEEVFNKPSAKLIGKGFLENVNPQDKLSVLKAFSDCNNLGKQQSVNFRCQSASANGNVEVSLYELRVSKFHCDARQIFLASIRNITMQDTELNIAREEVEKAQTSNSTKSLFLSNMSHELRTPLNAIIGFSQMLMGEAALVITEEKKTEYAGLINQSSNHLLNIINDILDVSKIEAGKFKIIPEVIDVSETVKSTLDLMVPIADEADISLTSNISSELPNITADPRALRQILMNLIANAIKFSCPGNQVTVSLRRNTRQIFLEVSDTGLGMRPETLDKLGNSFFQVEQTASRRFEGTGLGLSIVFGLVQLHDGNIKFKSKLGQGTQVCVELPISFERAMPIPSDPNESLVYLNKAREPNLLRKLEANLNVRKAG